MTPRPDVLYAAPGAGLGHLVRAAAVCRCLEAEGVRVRIVTHSRFTPGLRHLTNLKIDFIPSTAWRRSIPAYARGCQPGLVVLDTFPWGLRGEWKNVTGLRFVTLARRLKVAGYLEAAGLGWEASSLHLARIIVSEPLTDDHLALLEASQGDLKTLPGRIRFPSHDTPIPLPSELAGMLTDDRVWLVVHSGPVPEVLRLAAKAEEDMEKNGGGRLAAILPLDPGMLPCPVFEYFPAARAYEQAFRVVTGAGYNSLADLAACPEKHVPVPFDRRYDDQAGRLTGRPAGRENGAPAAARLIMEWL
ncbi:MAG: hypothetical protein V1742_10690 [Pseudomonadota bacterium]